MDGSGVAASLQGRQTEKAEVHMHNNDNLTGLLTMPVGKGKLKDCRISFLIN